MTTQAQHFEHLSQEDQLIIKGKIRQHYLNFLTVIKSGKIVIDFEFYKIALAQHALALDDVKQDRVSQEEYFELCKIALAQDGRALEYVKQDRILDAQYLALCQIAVVESTWALQYVKKDRLSDAQYFELCRIRHRKDSLGIF
jgi:hypothetical protein